MKRLRERPSGEQGIDLSPLIDVVFILLIFFMVTTTFVRDTQLDLERPGSQSGQQADSKALRVYIDRTAAIYVEDAPVKPWMLQSRVRDFLRNGTSETVLVVTDRHVASEKLIEVVDQCRLAGAANVGVVTDAEAG